MKLTIRPLEEINGVAFGTKRKQVRKIFGSKYKEIRKNIYSKNTMDAYKEFHIYYDDDDKFEAIELYGNVEVEVMGIQIYPGSKKNILELLDNVHIEENGVISKELSIGISLTEDEDTIDSILFGCKDYYTD